MKHIADIAALVFILLVMVLSAIAIGGVWELFGKDTVAKAFYTLTLFAGVTVLIIGYDKFVHKGVNASNHLIDPNFSSNDPVLAVLKSIEKTTTVFFIVSLVLLALLGALAIWEVLIAEVFEKSLSTIGILAFSSFIIAGACKSREMDR